MSDMTTKTQVSAGGIAFRKRSDQIDVALISVGERQRWQIPKGMVNPGESNEAAARREVREEAGVETELLDLIDKVEYWYYSKGSGPRLRFHKFVYFYLLRYLSGDTADHDHEVNEARWVEINRALEMLTFENERNILKRAKEMIGALKEK